MRHRVSVIISWLTSLFVAGVFYALSHVEQLPSSISWVLLPAAVALAPIIVGLVTYLMRGIHNKVAGLLAAATPVVLVLGALGAYVVVEGYWRRISIGAATIFFTALFMSYWRGLSRGEARFRNEDFAHLTLALHVFAMFFILTTTFGVTDFLRLPAPAAALAVGLLSLVTGAETLRRSSVPRSYVMSVSLVLALIMTEAYAAISMLPTAKLVNALVGTVVYAATLYAALSALSPNQLANRLGRQMALSLALVALVLSTARWA